MGGISCRNPGPVLQLPRLSPQHPFFLNAEPNSSLGSFTSRGAQCGSWEQSLALSTGGELGLVQRHICCLVNAP